MIKLFINKIKKILNNGVLILLSGTLIAQIFPILISPILTRLYTKEDFGMLAVFISFTSIIGSIINGKYENSVVLPKNRRNSINLVIVSHLFSFVFTLIITFFIGILLIFFSNNNLITKVPVFIYTVIPIYILILGSYKTFYSYNLRIGNYNNIARVTIYKSITLGISQLLMGILKLGYYGMIFGVILANLVGNKKLSDSLPFDEIKKNYSKNRIKLLANKYSDFPKYSVWGTLANTLSFNSIVLIMPYIYTLSNLGLYSLVERVLGAPISLLSKSFGDVYLKDAAEEYNLKMTCETSFYKTLKKLVIISLIPFGLIYVFADLIFGTIFGTEWREAGTYARILVPLFFFRFIAGPLSQTYAIIGQQKKLMLWQFFLFIVSIIVTFLSWFFDLEFLSYLKFLSLFLSLSYVLNLVYIILELKKNKITN